MKEEYLPGRWLALALFCFFALLTSGFDVSEGIEHANWARAILQAGEIGMSTPLSQNWVRAANGRFYSAHEIGNALALLPFVWGSDRVGRIASAWLGTGAEPTMGRALLPLVSALYVTLIATAFYRLSVDALRVRQVTAILGAIALASTTILLPYSRMLFDGVLGGMLTAWALVWAHQASASGRAVHAVVAGVLMGAAFATRQTLAVFVAPAAAMLLWDRSRRGLILFMAFALGMLPAVAWQGWYNSIRTGVPYLPAAMLPQFQNLSASGHIGEGLAGMLFSPGKSLFVYSPLLVLSIPGVPAFARRVPPLAWGIAVAAMTYMLVHAAIRNWGGDWGWGPRYLVPLTMPLALPAVFTFDQITMRSRLVTRWAAGAVLAAGLAVQVIAISTNWHYRYAWRAQEGQLDLQATAWSLRHGQLLDTARMLGENVARSAGGNIPTRVVYGASSATEAVSNTFNVWPVTAVREGVPFAIVAIAITSLSIIGAIAVRRSWAVARRIDSMAS